MILTSIKMERFRQYLDPIEITFSKDSPKNITLIIAPNGVGKTTLLQAFRYCFYGQRSAYFNLPKNDDLVNNQLHKVVKEGQSVPMYVEITFEHKNVSYIARRESSYVKRNNKITSYDEEKFMLKYLTSHEGWKTYDENDSYNKMHQILPDGLSQVFMFDGERMERNISESKFRNELKDSILGILGIKKYDKLISIIGKEGKKSSVLGILNSRITSSSKDDRKLIEHYQNLIEKKEIVEEKLYEKNEAIIDIDNQLESLSVAQNELEENRVNLMTRENKQEMYKNAKIILDSLSEEYLRIINKVLMYKMMIENKHKYESYINQKAKSDLFYDQLHTHTLDAILEKKICLCGHHIKAHSSEAKRLNDLKLYALPIEAAQNLNLIAQKYKITVEYKELFEKAKLIKEEIVKKKIYMKKTDNEITRLSRVIREVEKKYNMDIQKRYDQLQMNKKGLLKEIGAFEQEIRNLSFTIEKGKSARQRIEKQNLSNLRVNQLKSIFNQIKITLEAFKNEKDSFARKVLTKEFENSLAETLEGSYQANIDEKYRIKIIDTNSNTDVTKVLSTGQNVVIQLSFMKALIITAKKLSKDMDITENYGVIMDAALSNLDEKHIKNICEKNLINLDQLVFLSFKKQLRNEMYNGIKNNIGAAYLLQKNNKGSVDYHQLDHQNIDQIIHSKVGDNIE